MTNHIQPPTINSQASPGHACPLKSLCKTQWLLIGIIFIALALRLSLVHYGLPLLLYEDEPIYYDYALGFGLGHWHIGYFKKPSFFLYLYSAFYYLGFLYFPVMTWKEYIDAFWQNPTYVATIGRSLSVLFAIGTLGWLGKQAFGWSVALGAAFFLALDATHLRISPIVISDIPALFFIMGAAWNALKISETGLKHYYLQCAVMIALAISFKYNIFSVFFLLAGHWVYTRTQSATHRIPTQLKIALTSRYFWAALFAIPTLFLILNPSILFDFSMFLAHLDLEKRHMLLRNPQSSAEQWQPMVAFGDIFFKILPRSQGWALYLTGLAGIILALWKARPKSWVLLSFPLAFLLVVLQFRLINAKYLLPIFPFWYLMAAYFLHNGLQWLHAKFPRHLPQTVLPWIFALMVLAVSSFNAWEATRYAYIHTHRDTRAIATERIEQWVEEGDRFLLEPNTLTLKNRLFRTWLITAEYKNGHFQVFNQIPDEMKNVNLTILNPRYVLINFGEAEKKQDVQGRTYYQMPYNPKYYQILQSRYQLVAIFAPYQISLSYPSMQQILHKHGFANLYAEIQENKTTRKRPGPCLLLMKRQEHTTEKSLY
jgi:hypothetical protein